MTLYTTCRLGKTNKLNERPTWMDRLEAKGTIFGRILAFLRSLLF